MELVDRLLAYVFVADAHAADFERLYALPEQRPETFHSVVRLAGTWDAMVAITPERLEDLDELVLQDVRGGHSPMSQTAIAVASAPPGLVTWAASPPFIIFCRVNVSRGSVESVVDELSSHRALLGVVAVTGAFDVLAEFGADTFAEVASIATNDLARVEGIEAVDTAFCTRLVSASHFTNSD